MTKPTDRLIRGLHAAFVRWPLRGRRPWTAAALLATAATSLILIAGCSMTRDNSPTPTSDSALTGPDFYTHREDFLTAMAACMTEEGFTPVRETSEANAGTTLGFPGVAPEQQSELGATLERCNEQIEFPELPINDDKFQRDTYEWLKGQRDCLESEGYAMPPAPTFATFKDQIETTGSIPWSPVDEAAGDAADSSTQSRALAACPLTTERW